MNATYCPEDNKLRLYIGRVPRDEYLRLRAEGWTTLHKQRDAGGGDFVATWTPERRDTALSYAEDGIIEDEDMGPEERAADRAERFGEYRDKRTGEATGHADQYESAPSAHGYQSQARAERAVARHDRIADRAGDAWSKAEYWQRRTKGVIDHALYKSTPGVRMGRIKELESLLRKHQATVGDLLKRFRTWVKISQMTDPDKQTALARAYAGAVHIWSEYDHPSRGAHAPSPDRGAHAPSRVVSGASPETGTCPMPASADPTPDPDTPDVSGGAPETTCDGACAPQEKSARKYSLYSLLTDAEHPITGAEACALFFSDHSEPSEESDWSLHYRLRLQYENQMLEAQGGRLEQCEVLVGGRLGSKLILKVNKSSATGRATSVDVIGPRVSGWHYKVSNIPGTEWAAYSFDLERLAPGSYTPPTPESLAELEQVRAAIKGARPKSKTIPFLNPTDADAERLQAIWNAERAKRQTYDTEIKTVHRMSQAQYSANSGGDYAACQTVEITGGGYKNEERGHVMREPDCPTVAKVRANHSRVVILTDKPQKPLPAEVWDDPRPAIIAELEQNFAALEAVLKRGYLNDDELSPAERELFNKGRIVRLVRYDSMSQFGFSKAGHEWARQIREKRKAAYTGELALAVDSDRGRH